MGCGGSKGAASGQPARNGASEAKPQETTQEPKQTTAEVEERKEPGIYNFTII